jgi:hypothetical protein
VKTIAADALDRPRDERDRFVESACAGDGALLREVRSLLRSTLQASTYLEVPRIPKGAGD